MRDYELDNYMSTSLNGTYAMYEAIKQMHEEINQLRTELDTYRICIRDLKNYIDRKEKETKNE